MRLHRLRLTAFQAFAGSETVDFDALAESGLFLLHGDTGAGKTTLLDAVAFALYGQVPGARARDARLRSDHAAPEVRTEVELEVTLRERRLRVVRRPPQERPKLRGEGMTREGPACTVEELDAASGEWTVLAARPDEARHELDALLGMTCDQFCQVVLLPQGEFATFLRADSGERQAVLERLFGTDRFARVEHWLNDRRKAAWSELQAASQAERELVAKVAEVAGEPAPEELDLHAEWVAGLGVRAEAELVSAADAQRAATAARTRAEAALAEGRAAAERRAAHAEAVERLARWESRRPERDAADAQLAAARRAAPLAALLTRAVSLRGSYGPPEGHSSPAELRDRAAAAREAAGALDTLVAVEARLAAADEQLAALARSAEKAGARARAATSAIEEAAHERATLDATVQAAREGAAGAERLHAEAQTARQRAEQAAERDRLLAQRTTADERRRHAVDAEQQAHAAWLDLRERRLAGMAAELAAGLQPGEPCSVCGATDHPAPAHAAPGTPAAPTPLAEREQHAQAAHEQAARERQQAERTLATLDAALAAARAVAGEAPADALAAEAERLDAALAHARTTAGGLAAAQQALAALATRTTEQEQARQQAEREEAAARATLAERSGALEADRERVAAARGEDASIAARADALRAQADAAEQEAAAREAGFDDAQAARAALLNRDEQQALADRIAAYDRGLAERRARAEQLAHELAETGAEQADAAAPAAPTPLPTLEAQATAAVAADDAATRRHALADQRVAALRRLAAELDDALADLAPVAERERTIKELAGLVDGTGASNRLHMRLSAYVLAARLEEVAQAATVRLEQMSNGRYQLVHTDERARKERRGGLELRVVDGWTGQQRSPATLSGGETFLASLALALGLADVVAAEAGGSRLETLFVDEGFGSLDERTLDEVLDVLDQLREGGRTVGIVSHVAELRQRIPARLRVVKGRSGSRVEHERAALAA
ncbi:MAG: SMC family ATPase [Actinobacteria bacterium]|nr:SMC family ATPase [Actinomycetota bacterium]